MPRNTTKKDSVAYKGVGKVTRVLYASADSSWKILLIKLDESKSQDEIQQTRIIEKNPKYPSPPDVIKIVGNTPKVSPGQVVNFEGVWKNNKFGPQFAVSSCTLDTAGLDTNDDPQAIKSLLCGANYIGPATAQKVIKHYGNEFDKLREDLTAENLFPFLDAGLNEQQATSLCTYWKNISHTSKLLTFLYSCDFGEALAQKIIDHFTTNHKLHPDDVLEKIKKNPYILEEITGISFLRADAAAIQMGLDLDSDFRKLSALKHILEQQSQFGHIYVHPFTITGDCLKLIGRPALDITKGDLLGTTGKENKLTFYKPVVTTEDIEVREWAEKHFVCFSYTPKGALLLGAKYLIFDEINIAKKLLKVG